MFGFNALLHHEGANPAEVKLARHKDTKWTLPQCPELL